ncbi:Mitochondrial tRNA methylthiotransferase CDK5RAP1 [Frankliniella fusca]|uniref:CDK5RAP1-like protein n=1 Tax=Frankliniella fusca TaxID=407009 RepID=A0AAE1L8Q8_9NEOP|nr:Mitochondrial tRNA methylthiotransferase CDK5RAP1 [Frankliniella fusca]
MHRKVTFQVIEGLLQRYSPKNVPSTLYCGGKCVSRSGLSKTPWSNQVRCSSNITRKDLNNGPSLKDFISGSAPVTNEVNSEMDIAPYLTQESFRGMGRKVYFHIKGCQMNVNDVEVVWSILKGVGFERTDDVHHADVILTMTCSIREKAELKIWNFLDYCNGLKNKRSKSEVPLKIGVLGCMAERLKETLLEKEKSVDLVAGPDSYKDLPRLLALTNNDQKAVNVLLSLDETYADIMPVRLNQDSVSAFVSIMRGCDNMCTYCIVPFTRGRERSRPMDSILEEVRHLSSQGVKEVTLLGQNVNSYCDKSSFNHYGGLDKDEPTHLARGFKTVYKPKKGGTRFADLLDQVSRIDPEMRIRFTSPHPKDFPDEVLHLIRERHNICTSLHIPAQSGNSEVLERMRRGYTRESYMELINHIQNILPNVAFSSDFIAGFCGETEEQFADTLSLIDQVPYTTGFLFAYSMREKTTAHRRYVDDVPDNVKHRRLKEMTELFYARSKALKRKRIGELELVLVEGDSRRGSADLKGRNDGNVIVILPNQEIPVSCNSSVKSKIKPGDYVVVEVERTANVLMGTALYHTTLSEGIAKRGDGTRSHEAFA